MLSDHWKCYNKKGINERQWNQCKTMESVIVINKIKIFWYTGKRKK